MYPHSFAQENPMDNYDMSKAPGRTYKYYQGQPLFAFGHGLSYTDFDLACEASAATIPAKVKCKLHNTGSRAGDEVIFMYYSAGDDVRAQAKHPVPARAIVDFQRLSVAAGQTVETTFALGKEHIILVDENGEDRMYKGTHNLIFSRGHGQAVTLAVTV
jgi:beta-glucosidase